MKKNKKERDFSTHPRFVPWPAAVLQKIKEGDPAFEDPVVLSIFFQQYLYKHYTGYRKFLIDCMKKMGPEVEHYNYMDLPPFIPILIDEVLRNLSETSTGKGNDHEKR